jgi:hypothetical protein
MSFAGTWNPPIPTFVNSKYLFSLKRSVSIGFFCTRKYQDYFSENKSIKFLKKVLNKNNRFFICCIGNVQNCVKMAACVLIASIFNGVIQKLNNLFLLVLLLIE